MEYPKFPSITRLFEQNICITEKIDGTNGVIYISEDLSEIKAGSRTRWLDTTSSGDNFGFAKFVEANRDELLKLGPGIHYGEWWGNGIQRNYGMKEKVFSLFNTHRWGDDAVRPLCCDVVPVLYNGPLTWDVVHHYDNNICRSEAANKYGIEFNNPEGMMWYFTKGGVYFKAPFDK